MQRRLGRRAWRLTLTPTRVVLNTMPELIVILITGVIGIGVPSALMFLFKIKPTKENPADTWIEGYIIGSEGYPFDHE